MTKREQRACTVCGKLLSRRQQLYCSPECRKAAKQDRTRKAYKPSGRPGLYRVKTCLDCGVEFVGHIKSYRCKACQAEADKKADRESKRLKAAGKSRELGSNDFCERCGDVYTVASGSQKYCAACAVEANREHHAKRMREINARPEIKAAKAERRRMEPISRVCCVCGKEFASKSFALTCSKDCRAIHRAAYYAVYDAERKDQKAAYNRARWEALTDAQRQEVNHQARERYRRRMEQSEHNRERK